MKEQGKFPAVNLLMVPVLCNQCDDAACVKVCPEDAITGQREASFAVDEAQHWPADPAWEKIQSRFDEAGFTIKTEQIQLPRSSVTCLIAQIFE